MAVPDGELVAGAGAGRGGDFYALTPRKGLVPRRAGSRCRVPFVPFDLLFLDGRDVCSLPYWERRTLLEGLGRTLLEGLGLAGPCWHTRHSLDCDPLDALLACLDLGVDGYRQAHQQLVLAGAAVRGLGET